MLKINTLSKSTPQLRTGDSVLAFGLIWPFLGVPQHEPDRVTDSNPQAQRLARESTVGQMQGASGNRQEFGRDSVFIQYVDREERPNFSRDLSQASESDSTTSVSAVQSSLRFKVFLIMK